MMPLPLLLPVVAALWALAGFLTAYVLGRLDRRLFSQDSPSRMTATMAVVLLLAGPVGLVSLVLAFALHPVLDRAGAALEWCAGAGRIRVVRWVVSRMQALHVRGFCEHDWRPEGFADWKCSRCGRWR